MRSGLTPASFPENRLSTLAPRDGKTTSSDAASHDGVFVPPSPGRQKMLVGADVENRTMHVRASGPGARDALERALQALPGVEGARMDGDGYRIHLRVDPAVVSDEELVAAIGNVGYDVDA
jgi:copper chaperone CopZ